MDEFCKIGAIITLDHDSVLVGYGPRIGSSSQPSNNAPSWYVPDYFLQSKTPWFQHAKYEILSLADLQNQLSPTDQNPEKLNWHQTDKQFFKQAFESLQSMFKSGELFKAVPYIFSTSQCKNPTQYIRHFLSKLVKYVKDRSVFLYGFWDESTGILGASPEKLFMIEKGNILKTVALAGTSDENDQKNLLGNKKELFEHNLVIEGIQQALTPYGQFSRSETQIIKLPQLSHLHTALEVRLKNKTPYETLVRAMHPTPALGAFPRDRGAMWLKSYGERLPRERFGAPFGLVWLEKQVQKCVVSIRNIQWDAHKIKLGAGCGVVADSQFENEWQELQEKTQAIKSIFGL